jgi:hypothetical protein
VRKGRSDRCVDSIDSVDIAQKIGFRAAATATAEYPNTAARIVTDRRDQRPETRNNEVFPSLRCFLILCSLFSYVHFHMMVCKDRYLKRTSSARFSPRQFIAIATSPTLTARLWHHQIGLSRRRVLEMLPTRSETFRLAESRKTPPRRISESFVLQHDPPRRMRSDRQRCTAYFEYSINNYPLQRVMNVVLIMS